MKSKNSTYKQLAIIAIVVVVVIALIVGYSNGRSDKDNPKSTQTEQVVPKS